MTNRLLSASWRTLINSVSLVNGLSGEGIKKIRAFMAHMKVLFSYEKNFLVTGRCFNIV